MLFYTSIILLCLYKQSNGQTDTNNIVFDLADLTIDYQNDFNSVRIEAFKSINNDLIIKEKDTDKYGQLMWLSIGDPSIIRTPDPTRKNIASLLILKPDGFEINIETLKSNHKKMFKDVVMRKYKIDIKEEQIVSLVPSKFECQIIFYSGTEKILLNGKVTQLSRSPLKVFFSAPSFSKERILFEKRLNMEKEFLDLKIECDASSNGKTYRENTLIITGTQINRLGLTDKVFGVGSERYVTRNQISQITIELYQKLNIIEEYQMPENEFKENFLNDFIQKTATLIYQNVDINTTLASLSRYNFEADLQPNVIYSEMSKIFTINKTNNKEILTLSKTNYERLISTYGRSTGGSAGGSFFGISFGGSASYATSQSSYWEKSNTLFKNQLSDLNSYYENEVQWERKGNIIVPKSIKVSKLSKALFQRDLVFSRVKRVYDEAPYKRSFTLETLQTPIVSDVYIDNTRRLINVEKEILDTKQICSSSKNEIFDVLYPKIDLINRTSYNKIIQGSYYNYKWPNNMDNIHIVIKFGFFFKETPIVLLSYHEIDSESTIKMKADPVNIQKESFELKIETWYKPTLIFGVRIIWTAIGKV